MVHLFSVNQPLLRLNHRVITGVSSFVYFRLSHDDDNDSDSIDG